MTRYTKRVREEAALSLRPGEIREIGGKVYGLCFDCLELVRVDKPLFGSLHLCVEDKP